MREIVRFYLNIVFKHFKSCMSRTSFWAGLTLSQNFAAFTSLQSLMYLGLRASVNTEIRGVYLLKMYRPTKQKFGNLMKFKPTPASDYKFGNNYYVT